MAKRRTTKANQPDAIDPTQMLAKLGDVGLKISGGLIQEEYARGLQGAKARETWQEMLDSPLPGAVMTMISMFAGQVEWTLEPSEEDVTGEVKEFVESCQEELKTPWSQIVVEMLSAYPFGFSLHEILYKIRRGPQQTDARLRSEVDDGRIGWLDFEPRSQDSIVQWLEEIDPETNCREIVGAKQWVPTRGNFDLPMGKLIHFVPRPEKRSPEGRSGFRSGWRAWMYARGLEEDESIGIGRDLTGIPDIQLPLSVMAAGAGSAEAAIRSDWEDKARKLRRGKLDALVRPTETGSDGKPTGYAAKLLTSGGQQRVTPDTPIRRHETRFLISVLCDFMTLGTEAVGSRALADPKINLTVTAIGGLLDALADAVQKQAIERLVEMNGWPCSMAPCLERGEVMAPQLPELIDLLSKAINGGIVVPNQELQDWVVRQIPGAPEPTPPPPPPGQDPLDALVADPLDALTPGASQGGSAPTGSPTGSPAPSGTPPG